MYIDILKNTLCINTSNKGELALYNKKFICQGMSLLNVTFYYICKYDSSESYIEHFFAVPTMYSDLVVGKDGDCVVSTRGHYHLSLCCHGNSLWLFYAIVMCLRNLPVLSNISTRLFPLSITTMLPALSVQMPNGCNS